MPRVSLHGRASHCLRSLATLVRVTIDVLTRRALGRPVVRGWPVLLEIGTLFHRRQFEHAFAIGLADGRAYFDSLRMAVGPWPRVASRAPAADAPPGQWLDPHGEHAAGTMLYLHGGGYAFDPAVTRRFAADLAARLRLPTFFLRYRLAPEHPHPAQLEDALRAYRHLLDTGHAPERLVVCGDSAGGHLALMLLVALREAGLPQPALAIGLCPWTDIGRRGRSQFAHDRYDMLQGEQTLQFGRWFRGQGPAPAVAPSPMDHRFHAVAPIYLQAGGKEVLVDMIGDFARHAAAHDAAVRLETWPDMPHEFQVYGQALPESREALARIDAVVAQVLRGGPAPAACARTGLDHRWPGTAAVGRPETAG